MGVMGQRNHEIRGCSMTDWSTTGHKLPPDALRNSDNLKVPGRVKARESRIAWERAEAGFEPFSAVVRRVVEKAKNVQS